MAYSPITWRTVNAPSDAAGVDLFNKSSDRIGGAFDSVAEAARNLQQNKATDYNKQVDANVRDYLTFVGGYNDLDKLQADKQAGLFQQKLAGYGDMIDFDKVKGAADNRIKDIRAGETSQMTYEKLLQDQKERELKLGERDFVGAADSAIVAGDRDAFEKALASVSPTTAASLNKQWDAEVIKDRKQDQSDELYGLNRTNALLTQEQSELELAETKRLQAEAEKQRKRDLFIANAQKEAIGQGLGGTYTSEFQDQMKYFGVARDKTTGQYNIDEAIKFMPPEQVAELQEYISGAIDTYETDEEKILNLRSYLNSPEGAELGMTPEIADATISQFDERLANRVALSTASKAQMAKELEDNTRTIKNNVYGETLAEDYGSPSTNAAKLYDKYESIFGLDKDGDANAKDNQRSDLTAAIEKALSGQLTDSDGESLDEIPVSVIDGILKSRVVGDVGYVNTPYKLESLIHQAAKNQDLPGQLKEFKEAVDYEKAVKMKYELLSMSAPTINRNTFTSLNALDQAIAKYRRR